MNTESLSPLRYVTSGHCLLSQPITLNKEPPSSFSSSIVCFPQTMALLQFPYLTLSPPLSFDSTTVGTAPDSEPTNPNLFSQAYSTPHRKSPPQQWASSPPSSPPLTPATTDSPAPTPPTTARAATTAPPPPAPTFATTTTITPCPTIGVASSKWSARTGTKPAKQTGATKPRASKGLTPQGRRRLRG